MFWLPKSAYGENDSVQYQVFTAVLCSASTAV